MSGAQFARHCGVKYPTFANWAKKRRARRVRETSGNQDESSRKVLDSLVEIAPGPAIEAGGAAQDGALRLRLPGGAELKLSHAAQAPLAAALIENLARLGLSC